MRWHQDTQDRHRAEIDAARSVAVFHAANRRTLTYRELRRGVAPINFRTEKDILEILATESHQAVGVLLSAVVVGDDGLPGPGIFALAESLGHVVGDHRQFHVQRLERLFQAYSRR